MREHFCLTNCLFLVSESWAKINKKGFNLKISPALSLLQGKSASRHCNPAPIRLNACFQESGEGRKHWHWTNTKGTSRWSFEIESFSNLRYSKVIFQEFSVLMCFNTPFWNRPKPEKIAAGFNGIPLEIWLGGLPWGVLAGVCCSFLGFCYCCHDAGLSWRHHHHHHHRNNNISYNKVMMIIIIIIVIVIIH